MSNWMVNEEGVFEAWEVDGNKTISVWKTSWKALAIRVTWYRPTNKFLEEKTEETFFLSGRELEAFKEFLNGDM